MDRQSLQRGTWRLRPDEIPKRKKKSVQWESFEQSNLFKWAAFNQKKHPVLQLMFAIPNGIHTTGWAGLRAKREGVKAGVPDIFVPVPRRGFHGLFIEMKRAKGGTTGDNQEAWIAALRIQGYQCEVCHGWAEAKDVLVNYLGLRGVRDL